MEMDMAITAVIHNLHTRNPMAMRNPFMFRLRFNICHHNLQALIWFYRLTFVDSKSTLKKSFESGVSQSIKI
jgi:hypothetical protein